MEEKEFSVYLRNVPEDFHDKFHEFKTFVKKNGYTVELIAHRIYGKAIDDFMKKPDFKKLLD